MPEGRSVVQLTWGILLVLAGLGVFYRIPQVMPQIKTIEYFRAVIPFIYFCFYLIGVLLIVGGGKKIVAYCRPGKKRPEDPENSQPDTTNNQQRTLD